MHYLHQSFLASFLIAATAQVGSATTIIEDFESYASQAEFEQTWMRDGSPAHQFDAGFGSGSSKSVRLLGSNSGSGVSDRYYLDLSTPINVQPGTSVELAFDFYLEQAGASTSWGGDWQLVDVRGYSGGEYKVGALEGVLALGVSRAITGDVDTHDDNFFQGRIVAPGHTSQTYYTLDDEIGAVMRSPGWHRLSAVFDGNTTTFSVDGVPAETVRVSYQGLITSIVLGSGLPSQFDYWVDNLTVSVIPEPAAASMALAATVLALGCCRGRKR